MRRVCWSASISAKISAKKGNASGELSPSAGVEDCSELTEPAKSYVWFMSVVPTNEFGDHNAP